MIATYVLKAGLLIIMAIAAILMSSENKKNKFSKVLIHKNKQENTD